MTAAPELVLQALELGRTQNGGLLFEAAGAVSTDGGEPGPPAGIKVGSGATIPEPLKALFPDATDPPTAEPALWFVVPPDGAPIAGKPTWLGIFGKTTTQLHGSVPLATSDLSTPVLTFRQDMRLEVSVLLRGVDVESLSLKVRGDADLGRRLGPLQPAAVHVDDFELQIDLDEVPPLERLLEDPASLLDAAFTATARLETSVSGLMVGALAVGDGSARLALGVRSDAGSRKLTLTAVEFDLRSPNPLSLLGSNEHLAGLSVTDVRLGGALSGTNWADVTLHGEGRLSLPHALDPVVNAQPSAGPLLSATLDLAHKKRGAKQETTLDLGVRGLRLTPEHALLSLPSANLALRLFSDGGAWRLTGRTEAFVGWAELARRLTEVQVLELPLGGVPPDVHVTTSIELENTGAGTPSRGRVALAARLVRPGLLDPAAPYAGPLGPLPLLVAQMRLDIAAEFTATGIGDWGVAGGGVVSTTGPLRRAIAIDRLAFAATAEGEEGEVPRLRLSIGSGLPPLTLPSFDGGTLDLLRLTALELEIGEQVAVRAAVTFARPNPAALATELGLPPSLTSLLAKLGQALPNIGEAAFSAPLTDDGEPATVDVVLRPSNPPSFQILQEIGALVNSAGLPPTGVDVLDELTVPDDFFAVTPGEIRLHASLDEDPTLELSASLGCAVFGETFDMTFAVGVAGGEPHLRLMAGTSDPIRLPIPLPDPHALLGSADVNAVAAAYGLNTAQKNALRQLHDFFMQLADAIGDQGSITFEISDFGLRVDADGPQVSGDIRIVQLPRFVEAVAPITKLKLTLGSEIEQIYIEISLDEAEGPLFTVPVPGDNEVAFVFRKFLFAYAWASNNFAFGLDAGLVPKKTLDVTVGGSGVYLPAAHAKVQAGLTATPIPVPIAQGVFDFKRPTRAPNHSALDELGVQAVIGSGQSRFVTSYVRELAFSPTFFLLWPGIRADAGFIAGGPNPRTLPSAERYLKVREWNRNEFFARFTVTEGTMLFIEPMQGLMLNPMAIVPPFLTANPPYWLTPPSMMFDLYAKEIGVSVNLPGLLFFDLTFERPLPRFDLRALLELAALAAGGFSQKIPATSQLRKVFYARLKVFAALRLAGLSSDQTTVDATVEANVADLINGAIDLMEAGKKTLDAGSDLIGELQRDPNALIGMIPRDLRRFEHAVRIGGFDFSGSLYLLTPEELADEVLLFFENKRRVPRGLAANRTPPDPEPDVVPVNQPAVLAETAILKRPGIGDPLQRVPDVAVLAGRSLQVAAEKQALRQEQVDRLVGERARKIAAAALAAAEKVAEVATAPAAERAGRIAKLALGDDVTRAVEAAVAQQVGRGPIRGLDARRRNALTQEIEKIVEPALERQAELMIATGPLGRAPETIADELAAELIVEPANLSGPPVVRAPRIREAAINSALPAEGRAEARVEIELAAATLESRLSSATPAARARAVETFKADIVSAIETRFAVTRGSSEILNTLEVRPDSVERVIENDVISVWRGRASRRDLEIPVKTFAGGHFTEVFDVFGPPQQPPIPAEDRVEKAVGYQIQFKDRTPQFFSVPVPTATATYKVELGGGRYRLVVRRSAGAPETKHDLPAAVVRTVPEGPGKAEALRDLMMVTQRIETRPRTAAEKNAVREQWEQSPTLYTASVLSRPEYRIKNEGGVHGPFYVGDLLKNPATGQYVVPDSAALVGGFKVSLFGNDVRMCGMAVGGSGGPHAFLYGHHDLSATLHPFSVRATGDFVAATGSLWQNVPLPGGGSASGNVIGFSGRLDLRAGGNRLLDASASGSFVRQANGKTSAALKARARSEGSLDLEVSDIKLARLTWSVDGDVNLTLNDGGVSFGAGLNATFRVDFATYGTKPHVITPAKTVCAWVPYPVLDVPPWEWRYECVTIPAITVPVPDLSNVTWAPGPSGSCAVRITVSSTGAKFELVLPQPVAGVSTVQIPALV